jgi:hypothetical protein
MKTLSQKQAVFALNVAKLIIYIYEKGFSCSLGEVFRTNAQALIYAKAKKGIQNSLHCKRLAIDINLFSKEGKYFPDTKDYEEFGRYWETLDIKNRWGGAFSDGNHFQMNE